MMYRKIAVNRNSEPSVTLNGKTTALASLLVKYRPLLVMEAARTMDQQIRSRLSASDLVQQTLLEAHRDIKNFNGEVEGQFVNWLKQILKNNHIEATRLHLRTEKRSLRKEQALPDQPMADGNNATPLSKILEGEAMTRLAQAISQLPPFQQEAVRLRYIEGYKLALIGERMGRSDPAIAGLLKRALRKLRILLAEGDHA